MQELKIGICRLFGQDLNPPVVDDAVSLTLHNNRSQAMHEIVDNKNNIKVLDWGLTNDNAPHEYITLFIGVVLPAIAKHVVLPVVKYLFEKLADTTVDMALEKAVSWVLLKLRKKQEEKKIGDFDIFLPNGTQITVTNPEHGSKIKFIVNDVWEEVSF